MTPLFNSNKPLLFLAPMEGITNSIYRSLIEDLGSVDVVATEFIRITGERQKTPVFTKYKKPLQIQVMGSDAKTISGCISFLKEKNRLADSDLLDLNVGCPSKRVNSRGAGAALLKEPSKLEDIVCSIRDVHKGTLSIKTRIGFQDGENFGDILSAFKNFPIDFISIHARSCAGKYEEKVNYSYLEQAASKLPYPVVGNGDIWGIEEVNKVLDTGVRGIMCGRGAIINPFIFNQIKSFIGRNDEFELDKKKLLDFSLALLDMYIKEEEEKKVNRVGVFKEYSVWFSKNTFIGRKFFDRIKRVKTLQEARVVIEDF